MPFRAIPPHLRRALIAALLLMWAVTQTLGAIHRALSGHTAAPQHDQRVAAVAAGPDGSTLQALFADHHDERDCRLFDQLAHADLAWGEPAASPTLAGGDTPAATHAAGQIAAQSAGYLARGPPVRA